MNAWSAFSEYGEFCGLPPIQNRKLQAIHYEIFARDTEREFFDQCLDKLRENKLLPEELTAHYRQEFLPGIHLLLVLALYPYGLENYRLRKWPSDMFHQAIGDVAIWVKNHEENFDATGLTWQNVCWEQNIFSASVIQLGRLQCNWNYYLGGTRSAFRHWGSGEVKITEEVLETPWECLLKPGDPVINLHIPACGPLDIDACRDSLRRMTRFFDCYQPEYHYRAAVCHSWFLDCRLQDILPESSNIVRFQRLGHVVDCPGETDVVRRVFGEKGISEGINAVPHRTKLQKRLAAFINSGGQLRLGSIFILKDEII